MVTKKKVFYNIFFGLVSQLLIIILGLFVPKLMMLNYGSEVNGLFSTLNNVYAYLSIVEGGIGVSALQSLYKPVANKDYESANNILCVAKKYYRICAYIYAACIIFLSIILPLILNTSIDFFTLFMVTFLQGVSTLLNLFFIAGLTNILSADGKEYVSNNILLFTTIFVSITKIILVNLQVNLIFLQLSYLVVSLISIGIYLIYFKVKYPWIDRNNRLILKENFKLKQRWSFLLHNIVYLIFNNTDTILISIFCGLSVASIYSVYNLVFNSILKLVNSMFNGLKFTLGQEYSKCVEKYKLLHDIYKSLYCCIVFTCVTIGYVMVIPFVKLYTNGVNDVNYVDSYLPILFSLVNLLSSCRTTENNLISLSYNAKQTLGRTIIEAIINIIVSIILVNLIGIYGVLIGTIIALLYRTNDMLIYANVKILNRKPVQAYKTVIANFILFFMIIIIKESFFPNLEVANYLYLFLYCFVIGIVSFISYFLVNIISNHNIVQFIIKSIRKRGEY